MRCSALTLATTCRGSWKLTGGHGSQQSRVGRAFHEAARAKVLGLSIDKESLITRYGLTQDEIKSIDHGVYNLQIRIPEGALVLADDKELKSLDGKLTGTPDLVIWHNGVITVVDWKSGWGDVEAPETNNQITGYALLAYEMINTLPEHPVVKRIDLLIVQPKLNQVKAYSMTQEQLLARVEDIGKIIDEAESEKADFTTGPWCNSCFKNMNCQAFAGQALVLASFMSDSKEVIADPEKALRVLLPFAKACSTVSKKIDALAKAWVDKYGPLNLGGGQTYARVIENKQEVDAKKAFETLKEFFQEEDIWKIVSASMTKIAELAVATKRGLSTTVRNRMLETGALKEKTAVTYKIIKGGNNGEEGRE